MKALVFRGPGELRVEDVADPTVQDPTDAVVRLTASAICGTDLQMLEGLQPGAIPGHEGVGVVAELGPDVRNLRAGDRVVICPTIACGACAYCRAGHYSQCDRAPRTGPALFGGGAFHGMQAERVRVPFAHVGAVKLPDEVRDDAAILLADVVPTAFFGVELAQVGSGDSVAIFGCGPVGQFVIAAAKLKGAGRILAVDHDTSRLMMAREQGAEVVDFGVEHPVETILRLTGGVDRAIVADGSAAALRWAMEALAKQGTLGVIGHAAAMESVPLGLALGKNLTIRTGRCPHRRYVPALVELVRTGALDPASVLTQRESAPVALEAYRAFDRRQPEWVKVELAPALVGGEAPGADVGRALEGLLHVARDGERGFRKAADQVKDGELRSMLTGYAEQRARFAEDMARALTTLGVKAEQGGTVTGALARGWLSVQRAIAGDDAATVVRWCEARDTGAVRAYEEALEEDLPGTLRSLVGEQLREVLRAHERMLALKREMERRH